jgi:glycerol-3-phosphate dehydrogenase
VPGFIQVAGIESPGLTSSPAIAQRVRGLVEAVLTPTLAPDGKDRGGSSSSSSSGGLVRDPNFDPVRRPIIVSKGSEFEGTIDDPDPAKNIICRCERVTEAEIRDALDRSFGTSGGRLTATDSVKWRTRAGMGK